MKVAIIGSGKMGRWFTRFFIDEGAIVVASDRDAQTLSRIESELGVETADNIGAVRSADIVLICVPLWDGFEDVIREIHPHVQPNQAVIDICTFKELPLRIMHKYIKTGITLGMHPMFGPDARSIRNQNLIFTPTNSREEALARKFRDWLRGKRARVHFMSPKKHDKLMASMHTLPHFLRFYFVGPTDRRFPQLRGFYYWVVSLTSTKNRCAKTCSGRY